MADPKGIYYGPGEKGWATVLPAGPNLAGLAAMKQKQAAAKKADDNLKKQQARDKAIKDAYDALSGPAHTNAYYQEGLNEKVNASIRRLTEMVSDENFDPARVRAFAATSAQDIVSWKSAGEQVWRGIDSMKSWNKENGLIIDEGRLEAYITGNILVDEEGKKKDPVSIYQQEGFGNPERFLYENPAGKSAGASLLNASAVIGNLLKQDFLKAAVVESSMQKATALDTLISTTGGSTQVSARPFAEVDAATGNVRIKDPDELLNSGLLSAMLDYQPFALMVDALVEKELGKISKEDQSVLSDDTMEEMRAEKAVELLKGYAAGGSKASKEDFVKLASRGRGSGAGAKDQENIDIWSQAILTGNPSQLSSALEYINSLFGTTDDKILTNNIDSLQAAGFIPESMTHGDRMAISHMKVFPDGGNDKMLNIVFYGIKDKPLGSKQVSRVEFGKSETIQNLYSAYTRKTKRAYGTSETGKEQVPRDVQSEALEKADVSSSPDVPAKEFPLYPSSRPTTPSGSAKTSKKGSLDDL